LRFRRDGIESDVVGELSPFNFGLISAYLVPGFITLWGASYRSETVRAWLSASPQNAGRIADLLYATLAAIAVGMTVSAFRWAIFDTLHHRTGIRPPAWDFSRLHERLDAYRELIEIHYRYYQFFANTLLALCFAYVVRLTTIGWQAYHWGWAELGFASVVSVLFLASRDALEKYYRRAGELLIADRKEVRTMANGGDKAHHPVPAGSEAKTAPAAPKGSQPSTATSAAKPQTK
jgi:hypothetical protein